MRSLLVALLYAGLAWARPCIAQTAGSDVEMWNEVDIISPFLRHATLTIPLVLRNSLTLANPQLGGAGPILDIRLNRYLTFTAGYLYVGIPHSGPGFNANVPLAAWTLRREIRGVEFADRNRAECLFGIPRRPIRYRNKLVIEAPKLAGDWRPYVSDEVFYDFSQSLWSQNRFQIGAVHILSERWKLNFFYLERDAHHSDPTATHAVGIATELHLTPGTHRRGVPNEEN